MVFNLESARTLPPRKSRSAWRRQRARARPFFCFAPVRLAPPAELTLEVSIRLQQPEQGPMLRAHAARGLITRAAEVFLECISRMAPSRRGLEKATVFLPETNAIERVLGQGGVHVTANGKDQLALTIDPAEMVLTVRIQVAAGVVSGNVHLVTFRKQTRAFADVTVLDFVGGTVSRRRGQREKKLIQSFSICCRAMQQDLQAVLRSNKKVQDNGFRHGVQGQEWPPSRSPDQVRRDRDCRPSEAVVRVQVTHARPGQVVATLDDAIASKHCMALRTQDHAA